MRCAHICSAGTSGGAASQSWWAAEGATPREGTLGDPRGLHPTDAFGHARLGGIGVTLEREIEARTGYGDARLQSSATRSAAELRSRSIACWQQVFGVAAMDAVAAGRFGTMVALRGTEIVEVPLETAPREPKLLDPALYETAELFFG